MRHICSYQRNLEAITLWISVLLMATACTPQAKAGQNPGVTPIANSISTPGYPGPTEGPATLAPYVAPPTPSLKPTIFYSSPAATPNNFNIQLTSGKVIHGTGEFPRIVIQALSLSDGETPALFQVERNQASEWLTFQGLTRDDTVAFQASPDGLHEAILLPKQQTLSVLSIQDGIFSDIYTARGKFDRLQKMSAGEAIASMTWMDNEHLLYTRDVSPDPWVVEESDNQGLPVPISSEVWSSTVDGKDQKKIASGPFHQVLGISPDHKRLYVTRLIGPSFTNQEGFSIIDLEAGKMINLWPPEDKPKLYCYDLHLVTLPDGTDRIVYDYLEQGPGTTMAGKMPTIYMGDPETQKLQVIWNGKNNGTLPADGSGFTSYEGPTHILWSPDGSKRFVYEILFEREYWLSDLSRGTEKRLGMMDGDLIAWLDRGIVTYNHDTGMLRLMDQDGNPLGSILLKAGHP